MNEPTSLDLMMDKKVIAKLVKTKWFQSHPFYREWKSTRSPKTRQLILDENSYSIALALRGKKLQVYLYKNDERGRFSEYVKKNGYEWSICVLESVDALHDSDAWWLSCTETKEEALDMCKEMEWIVVNKHKLNK